MTGSLNVSGLKITLMQQPLSWMDGPANLRHFDLLLEKVQGRDLIVLPEMFTTGFAMEAAQSSLPEEIVVAWMQEKARQTDAMVAGSAALQSERGPVNRFLLVEPQGAVHRYDKRHLFRMADEHQHYVAGDALHWQALLTARAIENQAYVAGCNRVGSDGNGHHYRGDSRIINPQGDIIAASEPHQAVRVEAELSLESLREYREKFPAWQDADRFTLE